MRLTAVVTLLLSLFTFTVHAKPVKKSAKPKISTDKFINLRLQKPEFNKDPNQVDIARVLVKDSVTGKVVQTQLRETDANSGIFEGQFQIYWANIKDVRPQIFILDAEGPDAEHESDIVVPDSSKRSPFVLQNFKTGQQQIEIFSTRNEAEQFLLQFKKLKKPKSELEKLHLKSDIANKERYKKIVDKLKELKGKRKTFSQLSESQKAQRQEKAKALSTLAMENFKNQKYLEAERLFEQAVELDPDNQSYLFSLGVSYYKTDKFEESIITLRILEEKSQAYNTLERDFYLGLNHYRLDEIKESLSYMRKVKAQKDENLSPVANFYEGVLNFKIAEWDLARANFQEVLDTSKDPELDRSAEEYIERINRMIELQKLKSKKFFASISAGVQYDSNVLLVSSSDPSSNSPSDIADIRYLGGIGLDYRPIYEEKYEWNLKAKGDFIYSSKGDNVTVDPLLYSIKSPFKYSTELFKKPYQLEISPGYESLYLDEDASGATKGFVDSFREKESYLGSVLFDVLNNFAMSDSHIMGVNIKFRNDTYLGSNSLDDNNPSAWKLGLNFNNMIFVTPNKNRGFILDATYSCQQAIGKNLTFNRMDLGGMYFFPWVWQLQALAGTTISYTTYPDRTPETRNDFNITPSFILTKPLKPWLNLSSIISYTSNSSNISTNTYNKHFLMLVLTASY